MRTAIKALVVCARTLLLLAVVQLVVFLHPAALRAELRILPRAWTRAMVRAGWLPPRWWLPPPGCRHE